MPAPVRAPVKKRQVLTFDDFSFGEYGREAAWRAPKGSFTGANVQRYVDGSIGPRNGLKQITLSGAACTGTVKGWGVNPAGTDKVFWLVVDTSVYLMTVAGVVTSLGSVATTPAEPVASITKGTLSYISVINDKLYKLNHVTNAISAIASPNSPGTRCLAQYGERTLAGGGVSKAPDASASPENRLYYSAANNPEDWSGDDTGYIDIGDSSWSITAILPQRGHCVIATSDGSFWILTGVPGVNPNLRKILTSVSPIYPHHTALLGNGMLGYVIASSGTNGSTAALGMFSGSEIQLFEKIEFGDGRLTGPLPSYTVVPLKNADDWLVQGGSGVAANTAMLRQLGAWSIQQWQVSGVTLQGYCASFTVADRHFFTDGGSTGVTPKFYEWRSYANRPAFTADTYMGPGDASTTPFTAHFALPEWFAEDGREVSVSSVVVDFTAYGTGSASTNHFDVTVFADRVYEAGSIEGTVGTFDESNAAASTSGTRKRKRFDFSGQPHGNAFRIKLSNLRGVAIHKIQVHVEYEEPRF